MLIKHDTETYLADDLPCQGGFAACDVLSFSYKVPHYPNHFPEDAKKEIRIYIRKLEQEKRKYIKALKKQLPDDGIEPPNLGCKPSVLPIN